MVAHPGARTRDAAHPNLCPDNDSWPPRRPSWESIKVSVDVGYGIFAITVTKGNSPVQNKLMNIPPLRAGLLRYCSVIQQAAPIDLTSLEQGVDDIILRLRAIGIDALRAARQRVRLEKAARDHERFPSFAQLHSFVDCVHTCVLPPELLAWARMALQTQMPATFPNVLADLARYATSGEDDEARGVALVVLFEFLRLGPVLRMHFDPESTYGRGMTLSDTDVLAARALDVWLDVVPRLPVVDDVNPVRLLLAEVNLSLEAYVELLRKAFHRLGADVDESYARRARVENLLARADPRDAVLVRNAMPEMFEVQQVSYAELRREHGYLFNGVGDAALRQRWHQLQARFASRGPQVALRRRGVAFVDLMAPPGVLQIAARESESGGAR
jgi:hypothetical protein